MRLNEFFSSAILPSSVSGDLESENISIPFVPKYSLILNFLAALLTGVAIMLLTSLNGLKATKETYLLVNLIPCFFIGVFCSVFSILAGFQFIILQHKKLATEQESYEINKVLTRTKINLYISVFLMIVSILIFVGGISLGAYSIFTHGQANIASFS